MEHRMYSAVSNETWAKCIRDEGTPRQRIVNLKNNPPILDKIVQKRKKSFNSSHGY